MGTRHELLIFGYDTDKEIFYSADFFDSDGYTFKEIPFSEYFDAFISDHPQLGANYLNDMVYAYKFVKSDYCYCKENIIQMIMCYMKNETPEYWKLYNQDNLSDIVFGTEIYKTLQEYIIRKIKKKEYSINLKPFYLLYDHKRIMKERLNFLMEQDPSLAEILYRDMFNCVIKTTKKLIIRIIKLNLQKDDRQIQDILLMIDKIKDEEEALLSPLLESTARN